MHNSKKSDTPDSCYSWFIASMCNIMYFIVFGKNRISGVLFDEIVTSYNIDRRIASLPFVTHSSIRCFVGPVAGCLIEILGFRPVILIGSVLLFLGTGGCFLSDDILTICILWGVVSGIGDALATCALPQIIYLYFEKHISTATGFALTGAPIAGFVLTPVTSVLVEKFGLLGTFLMLGGIVLHTIPIGMFLKEPKPTFSRSNVCCFNGDNNKSMTITKGVRNSSSNYTVNPSKDGIILDLKTLSQTYSNKNAYGVEAQNPMDSSLNSVVDENKAIIVQSGCGTNEKKTYQWFHTFKILWHPVFLLIALPRCLQMMCFIIIPTILVDFSKDKGINGNLGAYLLMVFSCAELFGRIAFGWVTDRGHMSVARFSSLSFATTAVFYATVVWSLTFITMTIAIVLLGTSIGVISTMALRLVPEYIEPAKQIAAMTSGEILLGPAGFMIPLFIGYFRDDLGSYNLLMYMMSVALLASSGLLLLIPRFA